MKHTRKRIISILAAAALTCCTLPQNAPLLLRPAMTASAAGTSGKCGENVSWELKNGVLTISGTGEMTDYTLDERPFSGLSFTKAVISDGVTSIGDYTFMRCFGVESIAIADSVKRFGDQAFYQCSALTDIQIPDSVTDIGLDVFNETPWLETRQNENPLVIVNSILVDGRTCTGKVTIPDGVTRIGEYAFYLCKTMTDIQIPDSVTSIAGGAFSGCWELKAAVIPDGVTAIEDAAFARCGALTSVQIPDTVTSIGGSAFLNCSALENIRIPGSVTSIHQTAFEGCKKLTIKGYSGSYGETYANDHDIPFESLGDAPEIPVNDWAEKSVISKNTEEAELVVRVGDIDACNDENAVADHGYDPFTAKSQYAHGYPWLMDETDPAGTDRIFVGSKWSEQATDGYASNYAEYKKGNDAENAYGEGALSFTMEYDASEIDIENVILQLCIDDFQALSWESNFTVTLNGKDAPFIAELLNHTDQTGPTAYIVSAMIPSGFFEDIAFGKLRVVIDETTGVGDGYAIDFARLLINYDEQIFTGTFSGKTEPGATVRLLGTSTTATASPDGVFTFIAIPGINAVRASKNGFVEKYDSGIVLSAGTEWKPELSLTEGEGSPDIDFTQFAESGKLLKGDYNGDKEITVADAVLLARFVAEDPALTDAQIAEIINHEPDYDGDGMLTIMDVAAILKKPESGQSA